MEWLWIIQLAINVFFAVTLVMWWKERQARAAETDAVHPLFERLCEQANALEAEVELSRRRTEQQLRFLVQVCEQAHAILMRHGNGGASGVASLEEEELKALRDNPQAGTVQRAIPSVQELEARKQALRPEIPMDLRSLLRDQLT